MCDLQSRATDFGSRNAIIELGAYSVGAYSLGLRILDLEPKSLSWVPAV